jgi:hypothetical protein
MKEVFIVWITFQLMVIGIADVQIHNRLATKTYVCSGREEVPGWLGVVFPLVSFVPDDFGVKEYCAELDKR